MPITSETRKFVSNYVGTFTDLHGVEYCATRVTVVNTTDVTIDPIGQPVIATEAGAEFYKDTSDIAVAPETFPGGAKVGVVVGSANGFGENVDDVVVGTDGVELTVMFRGPATIKGDRIDFDVVDVDGNSAVTAGASDAFITQLEAQGIASQSSATTVAPTYIS